MTNRRNFIKNSAASLAALGIGMPGIKAIGNEIENHLITPLTLPGQKTAMGLRCEPLATVRIGLIGLGMRGMGAVGRLLNVEGVEITAVCDIIPERVAKAQKIVVDKGRTEPVAYGDNEDHWKKMCERADVEVPVGVDHEAIDAAGARHHTSRGLHYTGTVWIPALHRGTRVEIAE